MEEKLNWSKLKNFPWTVFFIAIFIWVAIAGLNFYYQSQGGFTGTGILFPISIIYPNQFLWSGFAFAFTFLFFGIFAFRYVDKLNLFGVFLVAIFLVLLGNLSQGNFDIAFLQPFYLKGRQYYTDALLIIDGSVWLRDFTRNLDHFQMHTKTHPPFVTLLHYWILQVSNIEVLAVAFFAIGSLSFPLFYQILLYLGFEETRRKLLLLLFAVIPSINIYLLVSIDALVLTSTLIFLLGFARIFYKNKIDALAFLLILLGLVLSNMISFSGLFLFAFIGCFSFYFLLRGNLSFVWLGLMCTVVFVFWFFLIYLVSGYNQQEAFSLASKSENPNGFLLFHKPFIYLMTRLEDLCEILLFLSFGFLAVLFSKETKIQVFGYRNINILFFSAISAISAMFLTGAYVTGETARACLFLTPYFLILLKDLNSDQFKILFYLSLFQTFGMQMIGNFYW
jgi:hypothetical protein